MYLPRVQTILLQREGAKLGELFCATKHKVNLGLKPAFSTGCRLA